MYGQRSHLVTAEYWRWWVVHLWVEGFFEVFATVVIAFLFTRLKLLEIRTATRAVALLHHHLSVGRHHRHLPSPVLCRWTPRCIALGAIFSAFEVVPLTLIGYEAWENIRLANPREGTVDCKLQVAHLLLCRGGVLEPCGRGRCSDS